MVRRAASTLVLSAALLVGGLAAAPGAGGAAAPGPGSPGAGDPYFPLAGNGGYDVRHYNLRLAYHPATDRLAGVARISARATQGLTRFNLDLDGLRVHAVKVDGRRAAWSRAGGELRVTPARVLPSGKRFVVVVRYAGVPETLPDGPGFIHTDDGNIVAGQPAGASTWYPVNDHPTDKAAYTFHVTAPKGRKVVANGELVGRHTARGWTTWHWKAREPMAPYLTTVNVGEWRLRGYEHDGIEMWDAIDPDLFDPLVVPRTGRRMAISQQVNLAYERLTRRITVPDGGGRVSFWVNRLTEPGWDHFLVEARTAGGNDWTTLRDLNGHTERFPGEACAFWQEIHPFLEHYQSVEGGECRPTGTTGAWHSATGTSEGYERWAVDLAPWAGRQVELSLSVVTDDVVAFPGVFVDDIRVSTGEGSTSFEPDGNPNDGWTVRGAPEGSPGNEADWILGTAADGYSTGKVAQGSLDRQGEIIDFLESRFGPYPFSAGGGIVDDIEGLGFALETQTRPIYAPDFFTDSVSGDAVVVHEIAHQWFGDSLAVERWRHLWLNEGFASYAEWLWSEREGLGTAQQNFDFWYGLFPPDDPFWQVRIGDPGPDDIFNFAVYQRGAMTLHQLRLRIGDQAFFTVLRRWARENEGGNVATPELIALAEEVSGQELDGFFRRWLFTPGRPEVASGDRMAAAPDRMPPVARAQLRRDAS